MIHEQEMTEKNVAARLLNGPQSRGPATPEGKANSAAANLRHGFYSQSRDEVMIALGENPEEFAGLMASLVEDLQPRPGLESELLLGMGRTLWRMQRAERMREGLALKRIQSGSRMEQVAALQLLTRADDNLAPFERLSEALTRRDGGPPPEEVRTFVKCCGHNPTREMQELFQVLQSLPGLAKGRERNAARRKARAQLEGIRDGYRKALMQVSQQVGSLQSPENLAALTAPRDSNALLMQRMDDSNLRQLTRLTNTLIKVRKGALTPKKDVKNEGRPGYVHENTVEGDKMSSDGSGLSHEIAPLV
jgi:hypothetical protein